MAFLAEVQQEVSSLDFSVLTDKMSAQLNATTVLTIMGTVVGATVGIFLATWGGRKIINGIQSALKHGKIRG